VVQLRRRTSDLELQLEQGRVRVPSTPRSIQASENLAVADRGRAPFVLKNDANLVVDFLTGGIAGAVSKTITAPVERVKLIIQTQDANPKIVSGEVARFNGIIHCFTRMKAEQGVGAFWSGNMTNCIRYFPTQGFNLAFKDSIKTLFPKYDPHTQFGNFCSINVASGALAGATSLLIVYPLDFARTRLAADVGRSQRRFSGLGDCLVQTVVHGSKGIRSLYNGFAISLAGIIPYRGIQFGLHDTLMGVNPYAKELSMIGLASTWVCAQFSVMVSGFVTYPFDHVRRRMQMECEKNAKDRMYTDPLHCGRRMLAEEGFSALFKGAAANLLRGFGPALALVLYGEAKNMIYE